MNSPISAQPVTTGPATINNIGLMTINPMIVCLYQFGDSPRKLLQKAFREESLIVGIHVVVITHRRYRLTPAIWLIAAVGLQIL
jgi:hypothetical protein